MFELMLLSYLRFCHAGKGIGIMQFVEHIVCARPFHGMILIGRIKSAALADIYKFRMKIGKDRIESPCTGKMQTEFFRIISRIKKHGKVT